MEILVLVVAAAAAIPFHMAQAASGGAEVYVVAADFAARFGHCMVSIDTGPHAGMYLWGGTRITSALGNDVWYSKTAPFTEWIQLNIADWTPRLGMACVAVTSTTSPAKMLMTGGRVQYRGPVNDVWSTSDGRAWRQSVSTSPFPSRHSHGMVYDGVSNVYLFGGSTDVVPLSDVWTSVDAGDSWTSIDTVGTKWTARASFAYTYWNGRIWISGGRDPAAVTFTAPMLSSEVWSSVDGANWLLVGVADDMPSVRYGASMAGTSATGLVLIGGTTGWPYGDRNDWYHSKDGRVWDCPRRASPPFAIGRSHQAATTNNGIIYMSGGYSMSSIYYQSVLNVSFPL